MTPSVQPVGAHVVKTNARCLIKAARQVPKHRHICLEEGTLAELLNEEMDALDALNSEAKKAMLVKAKRHGEFRRVNSLLGLGPVRTAELLPIVVTPCRFQGKRGSADRGRRSGGGERAAPKCRSRDPFGSGESCDRIRSLALLR